MTGNKEQLHQEEKTAEKANAAPTLWELFRSFFYIGLFTIGGGLAMMPILERIAVEDKKWFSQEEITDCLVVSQALPGVIAVNMATYTGYKKRGYAGAILSTLGIILPSFIIIIAIMGVLDRIGDNEYINGAFLGIKSAICGCIIAVLVRNGQKVLKDVFAWVLAVAAFVLIGFLKVDIMVIIFGAAVIGIAWYSWRVAPKLAVESDTGAGPASAATGTGAAATADSSTGAADASAAADATTNLASATTDTSAAATADPSTSAADATADPSTGAAADATTDTGTTENPSTSADATTGPASAAADASAAATADPSTNAVDATTDPSTSAADTTADPSTGAAADATTDTGTTENPSTSAATDATTDPGTSEAADATADPDTGTTTDTDTNTTGGEDA